MKGKAKTLVVLLVAALALAACSSGPDNDPAVAAGVISSAALSGGSKAIAPKVMPYGSANFSGSINEGDTKGAGFTSWSIPLNGTVIYNGDNYTIKGTLNYAFSGSTSDSSGTFTTYIYSPDGITISGPDYEGTAAVDYKAVVTYSLTGTVYAMNIAVDGTVAGTKLSQNISFSYSGT